MKIGEKCKSRYSRPGSCSVIAERYEKILTADKKLIRTRTKTRTFTMD